MVVGGARKRVVRSRYALSSAPDASVESAPVCKLEKPAIDDEPNLQIAVAQLQRCMQRANKKELREQLPVLLALVRDAGRTLDMDVQRKMHEYIFAHENGLEVIEQQYGADLRDPKTDQSFEHKSMKLDDTDDGAMCNVNIVLPTWPTSTKREEYAEQVYQHVLAKGDVLIEARAVHNPKNNYTLRLPAAFIARYAKEYVLAKVSRKRLGQLNIGGAACRTCHRVHRLDRLAKDSKRMETFTDAEWGVIVRRTVPGQCE